jgi:hypothetical protein
MKPMRFLLPAFGLAALLALFAGCRSLPVPPPPVVIEAPAPTPTPDFTIDAGMLDTWNAVGQILVRTDGVTYEGRAQMLGLYDVAFRGDRFLIITRALALTVPGQTVATQVRAVRKDGKADDSEAAIALLTLLQAKLPDELRLIAAGGRGKVHKGHIRN